MFLGSRAGARFRGHRWSRKKRRWPEQSIRCVRGASYGLWPAHLGGYWARL